MEWIIALGALSICLFLAVSFQGLVISKKNQKLKAKDASNEVIIEEFRMIRDSFEHIRSELILSKAENELLQEKINMQSASYSKLINQKKSSEVRTGLITENLAPFLEDFPFDPEVSRFLGNPIDLVVFMEDKVVFVEVKSGRSQLSKKQRQIRDLINDGKVEFFVYRVKGD